MDNIWASGSWKGDRPVTVNCILKGLEMEKYKSGPHVVSSLKHGRLGGREEWTGSLCCALDKRCSLLRY